MQALALRSLERIPVYLRAFLGLLSAVVASYTTSLVPAYYQAPYILTFPCVILCAWFLGMSGAVGCAVTAGLLIDYYIDFPAATFTLTGPGDLLRLLTFLGVSIFFSWLVRLLKKQGELMVKKESALKLEAATSEKRLAEERARSLELVQEKDVRLRLALAAGRVGLWDWDMKTGELTWSDEYFALLGLDPRTVVPTEDLWRSVVHPEDLIRLRRLREETRAEGRPFSAEHRVIWKDGSEHWIEMDLHYVIDESGVAVRAFGVATDTTQRRVVQASMMRAEKLAVAGRMAASIAHEINNPLEGMANLLFLASECEEIKQAHRYTDAALQQLMRLSSITRQTLRFHRQSEHARCTKLSAVLANVLLLCQYRLHSAGIVVSQRVIDEPEIHCLASDLEQVLANLIVNAIDSMPGGGRLAIRIRHCCDWRMKWVPGVRLTMADSGCGMDLATRRRIYEPFFTTKPATGTGLGLWVAAEIIARMRGDLRVWSNFQPGRSGTAFSLFLPLQHSTVGSGKLPETLSEEAEVGQ